MLLERKDDAPATLDVSASPPSRTPSKYDLTPEAAAQNRINHLVTREEASAASRTLVHYPSDAVDPGEFNSKNRSFRTHIF